MAKWRSVRIRQELLDEAKKMVEKTQYQSLSQFVSKAIRLRMQALAKQKVTEQGIFEPIMWVKKDPRQENVFWPSEELKKRAWMNQASVSNGSKNGRKLTVGNRHITNGLSVEN